MSQKYPFGAVQGSDKAINVPFLAREQGPGPVYCSGHVARPSPRHTGLEIARTFSYPTRFRQGFMFVIRPGEISIH